MNTSGLRIVLLGLAFTTLSLTAQNQNQPLFDPRRSIIVTGNGESFAAPDQATVRVGMTSQNSQASVAQSKVNETIQKTLDAVKKLGVPARAIRTSNLTLSPVYSDKPLLSGAPKISAFRADSILEITLEDTKQIGTVIDAAINSGANEIQGVTFHLKNDQAQRANALTQAAEEAKSKAQTIAKALGVRVGPVIEVNEGGARVYPVHAEVASSRMFAAKAMAPTAVEAGEIRVEASVTVRYEIDPAPPR